MSETRYTENHEWAALDDDIITIGITDYAQSQLGDIVYVELPEVGRTLDQGEETAVVESVKAAGDVTSPVTGEVVEVNDVLNDEPELVNQDPENEGWFFKVKMMEPEQYADLQDKGSYSKLLESLS
ncbi:MAG: glycine cleavage system protein GcvH [Proteobacteria bacterium]|nr:glycine cleavage system protein GcvH [Pseudomonadota bacterium]